MKLSVETEVVQYNIQLSEGEANAIEGALTRIYSRDPDAIVDELAELWNILPTPEDKDFA